jgi:hypothetical protein
MMRKQHVSRVMAPVYELLTSMAASLNLAVNTATSGDVR